MDVFLVNSKFIARMVDCFKKVLWSYEEVVNLFWGNVFSRALMNLKGIKSCMFASDLESNMKTNHIIYWTLRILEYVKYYFEYFEIHLEWYEILLECYNHKLCNFRKLCYSRHVLN